MMQLLCVCGNGMGTSTILKITVRNICTKYGIDANVESCSFGEALSYLVNTDLVLTSPEWADMLPASNAVRVTVKNLIDAAEVEEALKGAIAEHFPNEIKK